MTVKVAKLIDGSEVVFTLSNELVVENKTPTLKVVKPLCLVVMPTERGMQAALTPFSFGADEKQVEFDLNQSLILSIYNPSQELENAYREKTSGIVLARGSLPQSPIVGV